jgi:1-pyrroline-5-carboxylate dehydrogenase
MTYENEYTLLKFMMSKGGEETFHQRYEEAIENIKPEFGRRYTMIIGGKNIKSSETFVHISPIDTRIVLAYFQCGTAKHTENAIKVAKKAFESWGKTDYNKRIKICRNAVDIMIRRKFELAAWLSYENGKNRYEAIGDVDEAIDFIRYYSEVMEKNNGFIVETKSAYPNEKSKSVMKPYGVWGIISPFNFPAAILVGMSIGALITGNTIVLKPASDAPIIGYKFVEIMKEAGLPDGVLNFITGSGSKVGKAIVDSKDVAGIAFTGSREVGYRITKEFSKVKRHIVIAELGGKNPVIVTENADLDKAIEGILKAAFSYSGQKCSACSRVYVQKRIKDKFVERLVEKTKNLPIGNPLESNTFMGPLINSNAYKNYQKYIKLAFRDGMVLAGGGFIKKDDNFKYGYYVEPTIVDGLPKNHRLFREELFMPILCITDYDDFDKAIELCNHSDYGLTAGIYSNKKEEIDKFLDNIESGVIYVNRNISATTTGAMVGCQSFGGWKDSGTTGKGTGGPYYLTQFMGEQSQTCIELNY